jgi:hypothetical protein
LIEVLWFFLSRKNGGVALDAVGQVAQRLHLHGLTDLGAKYVNAPVSVAGLVVPAERGGGIDA